jgi:hypothetical protein
MLGEQLTALSWPARSGNGNIGAAGDLLKAAADKAEEDAQTLMEFNEKLLHPEHFEVVEAVTKKPKQKPAPGLPSQDELNARKKTLDQLLKLDDENIAAESDLLKARNEAFAAYYQADYLAISEYYDLKAQAQEEALAKQIQLYEHEKELLQKRIEDKAIPETERIEAQTKLNEVIAKEAKLEGRRSEGTTKAWFGRRRQGRRSSDQITEDQPALLEIGSGPRGGQDRRAISERSLPAGQENYPGTCRSLQQLGAQRKRMKVAGGAGQIRLYHRSLPDRSARSRTHDSSAAS